LTLGTHCANLCAIVLVSEGEKALEEFRIIPLDEIRDSDGPSVGAKAASLARLMKIGLRVPPGFCIPAAAYREHIDKLDSDLRPTLEKLSSAEVEKKSALLADIRGRIAESPLSESLQAEIENHCGKLGAERLAVRSSATAEDLPGHSFAGQYDTFLDVAGPEACLEAVKKCWASLWTDRAFEYRERGGFDHLEAEMAVIVQELVSADAAGVVFTADPVSGESDRLIIEACRGLGEGLVSGKVTPDRFVIDAAGFSIVSKSAATADAPCIDEKTARRLAELAKKAEKEFGSPQDIEWAVKGGEIFFLQSRPITTLRPESIEDRQVWTNLNAGEVMPDVVTPMTWSMVPTVVDALFDAIVGGIGLDFGSSPILGRIAGRVYFNLNTVAGIVRLFPGMNQNDVTRVFGGEQQRLEAHGKIEFSEEDVPRFDFSLVRLIARLPVFLYRALSLSSSKIERLSADMRRKVDEIQYAGIGSMSEEQLADLLKDRVGDILRDVPIIAFAGMRMFFFPMLEKVCGKWLKNSDGTYANRLLAGVGGMQSARAGFDLWRLAARARENSAVEEALLSGEAWEQAREKIAEAPGGDEFLASWSEFMAEHGHHARGEIEFYNARWHETPDYVLDIVQDYLRHFESMNPVEDYERRAKERGLLEEECRGKLRNPIKRRIFSYCLRNARGGSLIRENFKSLAVRGLAALRGIMLALGKKLADRNVLEDADDIFFLEMDEIDPVRKGSAGFDVKEVVASRRAEYERNLTITPPQVVVGKFDPDNFVPDEVDETAETLHGVAVSAGVAVGPARVILRASTEEKVLPGEILVAPFTDPGWTPYFIPAAAIVMDMGGILSHGSIVAREYGIPAVVNVGPATKIIKTGQTIRVDGNTGVVKILS